MLEDLEARTVPLSMNWKSGMMSIATANQAMGGREQLFVRRKVVQLLGHSSQQAATGDQRVQNYQYFSLLKRVFNTFYSPALSPQGSMSPYPHH